MLKTMTVAMTQIMKWTEKEHDRAKSIKPIMVISPLPFQDGLRYLCSRQRDFCSTLYI